MPSLSFTNSPRELGESSHFLDYLSARYLNNQSDILVGETIIQAWLYGNMAYSISPSGKLDVYSVTALYQKSADYVDVANNTF